MRNCELTADSFDLDADERQAVNRAIKEAIRRIMAEGDCTTRCLDITFRFRALSREVYVHGPTDLGAVGAIVSTSYD